MSGSFFKKLQKNYFAWEAGLRFAARVDLATGVERFPITFGVLPQEQDHVQAADDRFFLKALIAGGTGFG